MGDKLGRKKTIIIGLACNTVGAILQVSAFQFPQLIIGRVINGFGMGKWDQ
jgi:MFS family permease